jgi:hypothetical protein
MYQTGVKRTVRRDLGRSGRLRVGQSRCRTVPAIWNQAASSPAPHNPKVAGSNPAPATKKALGIPTCAEGFLASRVGESAHVKPVSNIGSDTWLESIGESENVPVAEGIARTVCGPLEDVCSSRCRVGFFSQGDVRPPTSKDFHRREQDKLPPLSGWVCGPRTGTPHTSVFFSGDCDHPSRTDGSSGSL